MTRRMWMALATSTAALAAACATHVPMGGAAAPRLAAPSVIRVRVAGHIRRVPLEEYVLGTALSEVSPVGESERVTQRIFEVQAVVARTYAAAHLGRHRAEGFDVCDTTHCQLYEPSRIGSSRFTAAARAAVEATADRVVAYQGRLVQTLFHADCGGHLASAHAVWGGAPVPYLVSHRDSLPRGTHRTWEFTRSLDDVRTAINRADSRGVGPRLVDVVVVERDESGRAARIDARGARVRTFEGDAFRAIMAAAFGPRAIQSTRFTVTRLGTTLRFTGSGFGHGVGLCQVGAAARARQGAALGDILAVYYPGARLIRAN